MPGEHGEVGLHMICFDGVHLASSSLEDLHHVAERIGLKKEWFQDVEKHPHYDILPGKIMCKVNELICSGEICRCSSKDLVKRCFRRIQ